MALATYPIIVAAFSAAHINSVFSRSPQMNPQFDIICVVHGHEVKAYHPENIGYANANGPPEWSFIDKYSIDLKNGMFADLNFKLPRWEKLAGQNKKFLTLRMGGDFFERYYIGSSKYYHRSSLGAYTDGVTTGHCRRLKFSGLPKLRSGTR